MTRAPMALFFSASRSKNWSSLGLSSVCAYPAVQNASVSKVANNILTFIDGMSDISEQRREEDDDDRRPRPVDWQVIRLPFFEGGERSASTQETEVEHGGPRQIDQKN